MGRGGRGYSDILATVLVLGVVLAAGIALWALISSYAGLWRQEEVRKVGDQALVLRSNIGADYVYYPDMIYGYADRGIMLLRNTGREPIIIFRILTIKNGTVVYDTGIDDLARLNVGEAGQLVFRCPTGTCSENDRLLVQVHYIPEQLYDPSNPGLSKPDNEVLLFKVATFEASRPNYGLASGCVLPTENWLLIELIDPKEDNIYGQSTDFVKVRLLNASAPRSSYDFRVVVRDRNGVEAQGTASVSGALPQEVYVQLDRGGLEPPLTFTFQSLMPDFTIVPPSWGYPNSFGNYVDYSKMRIDLERMRIDEVILSVGFWEDGNYELAVEIYDCNGVLISRGVLRTSVELGSLALYIDQYSIVLDRPVNVFDIGWIVVRTTDVTPVTTTTTTVTKTVTETQTTTSTITTKIPGTTSRTTTTTTRTITVTTPSTTTTSTRTLISYTTVRSTTTTRIITRTTTSFTATITSVTTSTVWATVTVYSPTITQTTTSTTTRYTTTITLTRTFTNTVVVTVTTTTTTTTTTTATGGASSGQGVSLPVSSASPSDWPFVWQVLLYLSLGPLLLYPVGRRLRGVWSRIG